MKPPLKVFFFFFGSLALECVLSREQSSPHRWAVMNYRRKVFGGIVWIISVLLEFLCLLFTMEVYSVCCGERKASFYGPSLASLLLFICPPVFRCSMEGRIINPHYSGWMR